MNGREPFPDLVVRPVTTDDHDGIVASFRRLSPESTYRRFFTLLPDPEPFVTRHLALVDHQDHEALVVLDGDEIVAVGQWDRLTASPDEAEMAVTVEDAWQHVGLGRALTRMLAADAHRHGVELLSANILTDNRPALGLASRMGPATVALDGAETHFTFPIAS
jgi:GNAT superfamily N-acetyltransferase